MRVTKWMAPPFGAASFTHVVPPSTVRQSSPTLKVATALDADEDPVVLGVDETHRRWVRRRRRRGPNALRARLDAGLD